MLETFFNAMFKMISVVQTYKAKVQQKRNVKFQTQIFNPRLHTLSDGIINVFMMILFLISLKDMHGEMIPFYFNL